MFVKLDEEVVASCFSSWTKGRCPVFVKSDDEDVVLVFVQCSAFRVVEICIGNECVQVAGACSWVQIFVRASSVVGG